MAFLTFPIGTSTAFRNFGCVVNSSASSSAFGSGADSAFTAGGSSAFDGPSGRAPSTTPAAVRIVAKKPSRIVGRMVKLP